MLLSSCTTLASKDKSGIENNIFIPYFPDLNINQVTYNVDDNGDVTTITVPYWWFKAVLTYASDVEAAAQAIQSQE